MPAANPSPIISDHDVILGFAEKYNSQHPETCAAMVNLLSREATDDDRDRLTRFLDRYENLYPITCDALGRVLSGGV